MYLRECILLLCTRPDSWTNRLFILAWMTGSAPISTGPVSSAFQTGWKRRSDATTFISRITRALSSVWLMRMILRGHGISIVRGCWMCPSHSLPQPIHRNPRLISGPVGQIHCPEAISTPTLPRRMCISMSPGKGFACTTMAFWMMVIKKLG